MTAPPPPAPTGAPAWAAQARATVVLLRSEPRFLVLLVVWVGVSWLRQLRRWYVT